MDFLNNSLINSDFIDFLQKEGIVLAGILCVATIAYIATHYILEKGVLRLLQSKKNFWHGKIKESRLFSRISYLAPTVIIYNAIQYMESVNGVSERLLNSYTLLMTVLILSSFLFILQTYLTTLPMLKDRPIKGYIQLARLFLLLLGAILIVCALLDVSPWGVLSGLGALTAVMLLVFRDTILSIIASVQISAYDLVKVGDWIEMQDYRADGDVIDVSLHTIQVQNWDRTIVTIPTHALVEKSFKNWRGMVESGGRRIKRAILIDQHSVRHITPDEGDAFAKVRYLQSYIIEKQKEIDDDNAKRGVTSVESLDARCMTNLGLLRAYMTAYLRAHPKVHQGLTQLVRHLEPTPHGIPFEIYCFTNDTAWAAYEGIQADIFDHLLASIERFDLRVFQVPSGHDMRAFVRQESKSKQSITHKNDSDTKADYFPEAKAMDDLTQQDCEHLLRQVGYSIDSYVDDVYTVVNVRGKERRLKGLASLQAFAYAQSHM